MNVDPEQTMLEKVAAFVKEPAGKILKYRFEEKCLIVIFVDGRKVFYALDQAGFAENDNYKVEPKMWEGEVKEVKLTPSAATTTTVSKKGRPKKK
jgi:hypothetical protein